MNTQRSSSAQNSLSNGSIPELDAMIAPSIPEIPVFLDLDMLVAESMQQKKDAEAVKLSRSLLAKGGMEPEARKRMESQIREHEMKVQWDAQAGVAMFNRQWCKECGLVHVQFLGFYSRQKHRASKIDRWIKTPRELIERLPKEVKYEDAEIEMCEECAGLAGFPIDQYESAEGEEA